MSISSSKLFFIAVFSEFLFLSVSSFHVEQITNEIKNSWQHDEMSSIQQLSGATATIPSLRHVSFCGNLDTRAPVTCVDYSYTSTALVAAFVVDKKAYLQRIESKEGLVSQGVILSDSYCIGKSCEASSDLTNVQEWCLMFMNIDSEAQSANVTFEYRTCNFQDNEKDDLVLILLLVCAVLAFIVFGLCVGCCIIMIKRKKKPSQENEKQNFPEQVPFLAPGLHPHLPMEFYPPPPPPPPIPMMSLGPQSISQEAYCQDQPPPPPLPVSHVPSSSVGVASQLNGGPSHREVPGSIPSRQQRRSKRSLKGKIRFPI